MSFPATIDAPDTTMVGTTLFTGDDHALNHRTLGNSVIAIETNLGTNAGTSVIKNFAAGDFAARINSSNVPQQPLNLGTFGTATLQAPTINGLGTNSGTLSGGVYGTATFQGGTANNQVVGTPAITGGTANGMTLGTPIIGSISIPGTVNALGFSAAIAPGVGTITDVASGTQTINAQSAQIFYSVMGTAAGNRTVGTVLNPVPYGLLTLAYKTSGSANGTLVWGTVFRISQDIGTPTLGTGVGWNQFSWRYNSIDSKYDFVGQIKNLV